MYYLAEAHELQHKVLLPSEGDVGLLHLLILLLLLHFVHHRRQRLIVQPIVRRVHKILHRAREFTTLERRESLGLEANTRMHRLFRSVSSSHARSSSSSHNHDVIRSKLISSSSTGSHSDRSSHESVTTMRQPWFEFRLCRSCFCFKNLPTSRNQISDIYAIIRRYWSIITLVMIDCVLVWHTRVILRSSSREFCTPSEQKVVKIIRV